MPTLVLGTNNRKKGLELAALLAPLDIDVRTPADFPQRPEVVEDGNSFLENARKKAVETARFYRGWAIGEDSGLSVDALDGAPGIYSARFAATDDGNASDDANNRLLLDRLAAVPLETRTARYVCAAVLADPSGAVRGEAEGCCRGRILFEPSGDGGFGYDPLFEIVEYHRTFGVLSPSVKRAIGHRARAMRRLLPLLRDLQPSRERKPPEHDASIDG